MLGAADLSLIITAEISTEGVLGEYRRYDRLGLAWILETSCPLRIVICSSRSTKTTPSIGKVQGSTTYVPANIQQHITVYTKLNTLRSSSTAKPRTAWRSIVLFRLVRLLGHSIVRPDSPPHVTDEGGRVKKWPQCSVLIEKVEGCNHVCILVNRCGAHICW